MQFNYTFNLTVNQVIDVTLCGVPVPNVTWRFPDGNFNYVTPKPIDSYKYEYTIKLPTLGQRTCGRDLMLKATGNSTIEASVKVFWTSCKY